ncbi:MAG: tandem-95 repeat protein [Gaiellaceae bacterium]
MRGQLAVLAAVAAALVLPSLAAAAPPANDAYAQAEVVSGSSGTVSGTRAEATAEPGERPSMPQLHSIWYAWTAPAYGTLTFDTAGTASAWVFRGDDLATADMLINGQRTGFVSVRPGETYRIGLDDWNDGGPTTLSWSFSELPPPPANDDWASAQRLDADAGTIDVDTLGATRESCDPTLGNGHTLWFSWVAPADGELTVQSIADTRGTIAAVYTGDALCGLVQQAYSGGDPAVANVTAGQTYSIAVDTWTDGGGPTSFRYAFQTVTRPENDNFASATPFGEAYRGSVSGSALHATSEPGEWTPFFSHTVWYSWTPAASGLATVQFQLGNGVVSTGSSLATLTTVAYDGGQFTVTGGVTYYIQVASSDQYAVEWLLEPDRAPANDDFAAAQGLAGDSGYVEATNRLATLEPGEPDHGGASQASVWFSWTAPADGNATFYVDSSFWTIHQVYTGDELASLVRVDGTHDVDGQRLSFAAAAGTTYRIAVDGRAGGTGIFWLGWTTQPAAGGGGGGTTGTAPDAQPDSFTTDEDTPLTLTADDLLANDSDADGDALSLSGVASSAKSHGTVKLAKGGRIVFTPAADFNGTARFTYTVADSTGLESSTTVAVDVLPVNDPPTVTVSVSSETIDEGTPATLTAVANDVDGDPVSFDWWSTLGTVEPDGASATLTVDDGPAAATVEVIVSDGVETATATQDVVVSNVAPLLEAAPVAGVWGVPVTFTGSATDPSGADTAAGLSPSWLLGASPVAALTASRVYDNPGTYTATFSAADKDGGASTLDVPVQIGKRRATLSYAGDATAPFGFGTLAARFGDGVDAATGRVDGRRVTLAAGGASFTAATAGGVARASVGGALLPGSYALTARFSGDALYLAAAAKGRLTVVNSAGRVTGDVAAANGTPISFAVAGDGTSVRGSLTAGAFVASAVTALGIVDRTAWFAGTGTDGSPFVATVTDAGEPGASVDTVRLWIGGKLQPASGVVSTGNVQIHK